MKVRNCWATPTDDENDATKYSFIEAYAVVSTEQEEVNIVENCIDKAAAFNINAFSFGTTENVYLHCQIDVCHNMTENCTCEAANARKRRSTYDPTSTIKIGPITTRN